MKTKIIPWSQMGDYPLVQENTCNDLKYTQAALQGCGFINTFTIVHPGDYIVEVNGVYVGVIGKEDADKINLIEHPVIIFKKELDMLSYILEAPVLLLDDYSHHANLLQHIDDTVFQQVFIHHNATFISWFQEKSQDNYSFRVKLQSTINLLFKKLNTAEVINSGYHGQLLSSFNPFTEYLVNEISFDELTTILDNHKEFIGSYRKLLLDSHIAKNLVDFKDFSCSSQKYVDINLATLNPDYKLLSHKWAKSYSLADFQYNFKSDKYQILKKMFDAKILDSNKYNQTSKQATFFENFVLENKLYAFKNFYNFNEFIREIEVLEKMGMLKKVNYQKKDVFINGYVSQEKSDVDKFCSKIHNVSKRKEKSMTEQQMIATQWCALIESIEFNNL